MAFGDHDLIPLENISTTTYFIQNIFSPLQKETDPKKEELREFSCGTT